MSKLRLSITMSLDVSIAPVTSAPALVCSRAIGRGTLQLRQIRAVKAPGVTHIKYELG